MRALRSEIAGALAGIPIDFGGGCSLSKAVMIAGLIRRFRLTTTLDIGVYRGRSLFPQALAHARYTGGVAYGVDPWSREAARESDNLKLKAKIDQFVTATDFEAIYREVESLRRSLGLEEHCVLVRKTSAAAAAQFDQQGILFDLVHIDGNHDTAVVVQDVALYTSRLRPGGFVVMDDVSWESVRPACRDLRNARMPRVFQRVDAWNDYAVYWNTRSKLKPIWLRALLNATQAPRGR